MSRVKRISKADEETADPVSMLKEDHRKVKGLFEQFEKAEDKRTQLQLAKKAIQELKVHAAVEEEIFYPGVQRMVDDKEIMAEATQEHHVVHVLIDELEAGGLAHEVFHAKFIVLAENVRHHIKEEEGEMMSRIEGEESQMEALGVRMVQRKRELSENPGSMKGRQSSGRGQSDSRESSRSRGRGSRSSRRKAA